VSPEVSKPKAHVTPTAGPPAPAPRIALLRTSLPEGTIPVGAALLIAGIATYAFFVIGQKAVGGKDEFKPLSSLWFATFALAPGFFLPLEQELGRAIGHRRAVGQGGRPVAARVARLGLLLGGIVAIAILAASPAIAGDYFDDNWVMVAALVVAFLSYAPAHLARGVCSGSGRFRPYAVIMGADGLVRLALCLLLFAVGIEAVGWYGFAVAVSPLLGIGYVARRGALRTEPGPEASWKEVTPNLGWLLLGSVFAAALLNAGPVLTSILAPDGADAAGNSWDARVTEFGYGVLLARVPLFMFQAVQAALLPRLSRLAASGNFVEFRSGLRRLLTLVVGVGVVGSLGALAVGPFVLERVYDTKLSGGTLAILAAGSAFYMMALALAQAVIALKGHRLVGIGWAVSMAALLLATWLASDDVFRRVELGLLASSVAAVSFFGLALRYRLRSDIRPDDGSVLEAFTDMPFEA
jgi:O-antigen/teichoic acid export membrane protein